MPSQSASSRAVPATVRPQTASLRATIGRLASLIWRSSERHSLYQVMLATGHDEHSPDALAQPLRQTGQH